MSRLQLAIDQIIFARNYTIGLLGQTPTAEWFRQPPDGVSHVAWQVGHIAFSEYRLALWRIRGERPDDAALFSPEFKRLFGANSAPQADSAYPADELRAVTGQKPVITKAKKSIASFKLRQGMPIGVMVTLRGDRMYEFLDRLVSVALPRVRDFRGVSPKAFDGRGNYTIGIREQLIFPEIDFNKVDKLRGMNISIVTTARNDEQARALLKALGMPFRA